MFVHEFPISVVCKQYYFIPQSLSSHRLVPNESATYRLWITVDKYVYNR